ELRRLTSGPGEIASRDDSAPPKTQDDRRTYRGTPTSRRRWPIAAGAAAPAGALWAAGPSLRDGISKRSSGSVTPAVQKYVAILPFRAPGENVELKYQAEGVVESLSARLFQLRNVHLASPAAVESASKKDSVDQIARDLGVTLIVQ